MSSHSDAETNSKKRKHYAHFCSTTLFRLEMVGPGGKGAELGKCDVITGGQWDVTICNIGKDKPQNCPKRGDVIIEWPTTSTMFVGGHNALCYCALSRRLRRSKTNLDTFI